MRSNGLSLVGKHIVSASWLNQHIDNEKLIILDATIKSVSDSRFFSSERWIPNTRFFDLKNTFSNPNSDFPNTCPSPEQFERNARILGINNDSIIVVYDARGIYSSPRAWWLFKTFGFENIAVLDGGLPEWIRLGYETKSSLETQNWSLGNLSVRYQPNRMTFFKDIIEISTHQNNLILDARSKNRFEGNEPEPREGLRRGTIPNSENLPYSTLLNGFCLKPKTKLRAIFKKFDIKNKTMTFSCGSGITACILALAASILDYDKINVYDGSWTEYGTLTP